MDKKFVWGEHQRNCWQTDGIGGRAFDTNVIFFLPTCNCRPHTKITTALHKCSLNTISPKKSPKC